LQASANRDSSRCAPNPTDSPVQPPNLQSALLDGHSSRHEHADASSPHSRQIRSAYWTLPDQTWLKSRGVPAEGRLPASPLNLYELNSTTSLISYATNNSERSY